MNAKHYNAAVAILTVAVWSLVYMIILEELVR